MAVLKNDYEISLWENLTSDQKSYVVLTAEPLDWNISTTTYYKKKDDGTFATVAVNSKTKKRPTWEANKYYDCAPRFVERKIAIIGSDTMTSPSRALEPCLKQDINGTSTFTFKMYYHYVDPQTGVELENLWVPLLVNEAYIKVKWKGIWHDFVIKNRQEDSSGKSVTFTCEDLFITELSKTGFHLDFNTELENNQGTAFDLAAKALTRTGWTLVKPGWNNGVYPTIDGKLFAPEYIKQYIEEPVYELNSAHVRKSISAKVAEDNTKTVTIPAGARVLLFYSCLQDKSTKIQVVYNKNATTYPTDTNSILVRKDDVQRLTITGKWSSGKRTINGKEYNCNIFSVGTAEKLWIPTSKGVSGNYRAERLVDCQLSTYDAKAKKYVSIYTDSKNDNKKTYGFIGTEYNSNSIVTNLATWSGSGVEGWTGTNLYWAAYPEFTSKTNISNYNFEGFFRISPNGYNYTNTGIYSHSSYLPDGIQSGQKYMIRFRARSGNANTPTSSTDITSKLNDVNNIITMSPSAYFSINKSKDHKVVKHGKQYWQEYIFTCTKSIVPKNLDTAKILIKRNKKDASGKDLSYLWITDLECFPVVYDKNNTIIYPGDYDKESRAQMRYYYYYPNSSAKSLADISMISVTEEPQTRFKPVYEEHNQKIRSIEVKQSNIFNILQTIAETFECWVRFGIKHNADGKIQCTSAGVPKKYITFTETIGEDKGYGFVYGIDLKTIQRTVQSNQLVTKTIVQPNSNEFGIDGFCTISRAKDNKPKTNFIFNFDYFIANKLLDGTELSNDLYTKSGDSIGYFTRLQEIHKLYDQSLSSYKKKVNALSSQEGLLTTYKQMVSSTQDELNQTIQDIIYFAEGKTTLAGADTYFKKNGYTNEVKGLINDKNLLQKNLDNYKDKVSKLKDSIKILTDEINAIDKQNRLYVKQIEDLDKAFNQKYFRYIQEGSWISEDYMDDNLYYLDGLGVAYTASRPQVQYNINVLRLTALEEFKNKVFDVGDVGYVIDREFFGYKYIGGVQTPIKEQIVISSITEYFDSPEKDTISIQNYKTQFEDLFQRITASSQSLQFSQGSYAKVAATISSDKTIDPNVLQSSLQQNISISTNPSNDGVKIDNSGLKIVNVNNSNEQVKITSAGIMFTQDGIHWNTTMDPEGININNLKSNSINTNELTIGPQDMPSFKWNSEGLNAYKLIEPETTPTRGLRAVTSGLPKEADKSQFVRFDQYGVYGIEDGENFLSKEYYKPVATYETVATIPTAEGKDWENHYSDYYTKVGNSYKHVPGVCPEFIPGKYYRYDIANNNYIVLDTEPTKLNNEGQEISIWPDKYTDYYIQNNEYIVLGDYYDTVPPFESGIFYVYDNGSYIPLEEEPRDEEGESLWRRDWKNYYYKIDEYHAITTPIPDFEDLQEEYGAVYSQDYEEIPLEPSDWKTSWVNDFVEINEEYLNVSQFEFTADMYYDENHNQISTRPTNWETTYYTYYTKEPEIYTSMREEVDFIPGIYYALNYDVNDEPEEEEEPDYPDTIDLDDENTESNVDNTNTQEEPIIDNTNTQEELVPTYIVLNEKPADWNTNYTDYFIEGYVETTDTAPQSGKQYYIYDSENNEYDEFIGNTFDDDVIYYEIGYVPVQYIQFAHEGNHTYYQPQYVLSQDEERDESKTYYINNVYYEITEDKLVNAEKQYYIKDNGEYIEYNGESFDEGVDYYEKIVTNEFIEHDGDLYPDYVEYYERDTNEPWLELETEPDDWQTNFDSYYFKQPDTYTPVDPIQFDFNTYYETGYVKTYDTEPQSGKTYYTYDEINHQYVEFTGEAFEEDVIYYEYYNGRYRLVEEDPGDFYDTYFTYYTRIPGEYVSIWTLDDYPTPQFIEYFETLDETPQSNKKYYTYDNEHDVYIEFTGTSFVSGVTYYEKIDYYEYDGDTNSYVLLTEEPEDWKENYCFYFTHNIVYEQNIEEDLIFQSNIYYQKPDPSVEEYVLLETEPSWWNDIVNNTKYWTMCYLKQDSYSEVPSVYPDFDSGPIIFEKSNPTIEGEWPANKYYVVENGEYKLLTAQPDDWGSFNSAIYYEKEDLEGLPLIKAHARFGLTWDGFFIRNKYGWGYVAIDSEDDFVVVADDGESKPINRIKIGKIDYREWKYNETNWSLLWDELYVWDNNNRQYTINLSETYDNTKTYYQKLDDYFGIEIRNGYDQVVLATGTAENGKGGDLWLSNMLTVGGDTTDPTSAIVKLGYNPSAAETDTHQGLDGKYYHEIIHAGHPQTDDEGNILSHGFIVYEDGYMRAAGGTFDGEIIAWSGSIGGLEIGGLVDNIQRLAQFSILDDSIVAAIGDDYRMVYDATGLTIYGNAFTIKDDPIYFQTEDIVPIKDKDYFVLRQNQYVTYDLTDAVYSPGWMLTTYLPPDWTDYYYKHYYIKVDNEYVLVQQYDTAPPWQQNTYYTPIYERFAETILAYDPDNKELYIKGNGEFTGTIYATDGEFTGSIKARDGLVGGFYIADGYLESIATDLSIFRQTQDTIRRENKTYYKKIGNLYGIYEGDLNEDGPYYENEPLITLNGTEGKIIARNISLGVGVEVEEYIHFGEDGKYNAYIYNPSIESNPIHKFIDIRNNNNESIIELRADGNGYIGSIGFNANSSELFGTGWYISPDMALFSNADITGTIHTSVFETGKVQTIGGSFLYKEGARVKSIVYNLKNNSYTATLDSHIHLEAGSLIFCTVDTFDYTNEQVNNQEGFEGRVVSVNDELSYTPTDDPIPAENKTYYTYDLTDKYNIFMGDTFEYYSLYDGDYFNENIGTFFTQGYQLSQDTEKKDNKTYYTKSLNDEYNIVVFGEYGETDDNLRDRTKTYYIQISQSPEEYEEYPLYIESQDETRQIILSHDEIKLSNKQYYTKVNNNYVEYNGYYVETNDLQKGYYEWTYNEDEWGFIWDTLYFYNSIEEKFYKNTSSTYDSQTTYYVYDINKQYYTYNNSDYILYNGFYTEVAFAELQKNQTYYILDNDEYIQYDGYFETADEDYNNKIYYTYNNINHTFTQYNGRYVEKDVSETIWNVEDTYYVINEGEYVITTPEDLSSTYIHYEVVTTPIVGNLYFIEDSEHPGEYLAYDKDEFEDGITYYERIINFDENVTYFKHTFEFANGIKYYEHTDEFVTSFTYYSFINEFEDNVTYYEFINDFESGTTYYEDQIYYIKNENNEYIEYDGSLIGKTIYVINEFEDNVTYYEFYSGFVPGTTYYEDGYTPVSGEFDPSVEYYVKPTHYEEIKVDESITFKLLNTDDTKYGKLINQIIQLSDVEYKESSDITRDDQKIYYIKDENDRYIEYEGYYYETEDEEPLSGKTYYILENNEYVDFEGEEFIQGTTYYEYTTDFKEGIIYYEIKENKNNLIIGVNSTSHQNKMLFPQGFTFTEVKNNILPDSNQPPILFLGNLNSLNNINSNIHGYGLFGENVYLTGSLTTSWFDSDLHERFAGVNTLDGAVATIFSNENYFPGETLPTNDRIVFWAGSQGTGAEAIQASPFQVTESGYFYASHGVFEGSIFVRATIEAATLKTAAIYGTGIQPALSIYNTNSETDGIHFYEEDLTDSTWVLNESVDLENTSFDFNINFTSNGYSYTKISIDDPQNPTVLKYSLTTIYSKSTGWVSNNYRTIVVTGGNDVTNNRLIVWLKANAVLQPTDPANPELTTKLKDIETLRLTNIGFSITNGEDYFVQFNDNSVNFNGDIFTGNEFRTTPEGDLNYSYILSKDGLRYTYYTDETLYETDFISFNYATQSYTIQYDDTNKIVQDAQSGELQFVSTTTKVSKDFMLGEKLQYQQIIESEMELTSDTTPQDNKIYYTYDDINEEYEEFTGQSFESGVNYYEKIDYNIGYDLYII